jgi:hypothetical protein
MIFYSCYYYFTVAPGRNLLKNFIVGMRFLLPIVPIFILTYAEVFGWLRKRLHLIAMIGFWAIVLLFSLLDLGMVFQHQRFLKTQEQYKNCIYENTDERSLILTNYDGQEFFQPAWGKREYTLFVYWKNRIPIEFSNYDFDKLFLLTVIRSDKEGNEYVREYAEEIVGEYDGVVVKEIEGDPELRLWRLQYERGNESETENGGNGETENSNESESEKRGSTP